MSLITGFFSALSYLFIGALVITVLALPFGLLSGLRSRMERVPEDRRMRVIGVTLFGLLAVILLLAFANA
ncbi:MAG TPA: hypothetical protein VJS69_01230 [Candidatus Krumholzibacteria bacterium]|nr:hypothetical protein [Candidatus Krumholzibacteria bacterium]